MSLRRLAAVATREVARISRAGPPPRVPRPASAAFVQTGAIARTHPHAHSSSAAQSLRASARHGSSKAGRPKLATPPRESSTPRPSGAAPAASSALPTRASAQSLHLAVENAYLNWVRNGITATALGMAFVHFRVTTDDAEFSLGGAVLQTMGAAYVVIGAASYVSSAFFLRRELALTAFGAAWYAANAAWPLAMYATGMACLLDWHPTWLLTLLAANAHRLPEQWQDRYVSVVGEKGRRRDVKDAGRARRARNGKKTLATSWGES